MCSPYGLGKTITSPVYLKNLKTKEEFTQALNY